MRNRTFVALLAVSLGIMGSGVACSSEEKKPSFVYQYEGLSKSEQFLSVLDESGIYTAKEGKEKEAASALEDMAYAICEGIPRYGYTTHKATFRSSMSDDGFFTRSQSDEFFDTAVLFYCPEEQR